MVSIPKIMKAWCYSNNIMPYV